jgi:hypothetical protein
MVVPPIIAFVDRHRARFFLVVTIFLFPDFLGISVIRVTVGWSGRRGGWHLASTASRLAAVSSIVRYCPVASLSPFLLYYSKFMVLSMVNERKLSTQNLISRHACIQKYLWEKNNN